MDIEQLTKTQMLMLTVLVSFMTAIATGIVTVTLLDEAPPVVTNSINRVVERTVTREPVQQKESGGTVEQVVERQTRVVVQEGEQLAQAAAAVQPRVLRLYHVRGGTAEQPAQRFLSFGVLVSPDGLLIADDAVTTVDNVENIRARGTDSYASDVSLVDQQPQHETALLQLEDAAAANRGTIALTPLTEVSLGQTALAFPGIERTQLARGYIAGFSNVLDTAATTSTQAHGAVHAAFGKWKMATGTPLISSAGRLIGLYTPALEQAQTATEAAVPFTRVRKDMVQGQQ